MEESIRLHSRLRYDIIDIKATTLNTASIKSTLYKTNETIELLLHLFPILEVFV